MNTLMILDIKVFSYTKVRVVLNQRAWLLSMKKNVDSLGENIDFGPNDAMGVIVSMILDDGEEP